MANKDLHKTAFCLYITDYGNFGVAHALYHATLSRGVQNNHSYEFFWPLSAYSLCHFYASTMTIKRCTKGSIPIVKRFLGENFPSPVKHGPENGTNSGKCGSLISHTRTVVRECCKRDNASQWRSPKFDPPPRPNPVGDSHTNRHRWLCRGPLHLCKRSSRTAQAYRFCACVTLRTKSVYSASFFSGFWVLATHYIQDPWTDFDAKYAETLGFAQGCAFSGSRTQNLISRPKLHRISAILGTIFDGTSKIFA